MVALSATEWRTFTDGMTGIRVNYPKGWAITPHPDMECSFKINGVDSGYAGELQVRMANASATPEELVGLMREHVWSRFADFKDVSGDAHAKWGHNGQFVGPWREITFKADGVPVRQRWYFTRFEQTNNIIVLTAPEQGWAKLSPVFNVALSSLERSQRPLTHKAHFDANNPISSAMHAAELPSWQLVPLKDEARIPLQVSIPKGWEVVKNNHGQDTEWKIKGKDPSGKQAELDVWSAPRGELTMDRFVERMDEEHFKPLAHYAKASGGHRAVSGAEAVTQSITFTAEGIPARMDTMYFMDREHVYCIGLSSASWSAAEMRNLLDRVAGSIRL